MCFVVGGTDKHRRPLCGLTGVLQIDVRFMFSSFVFQRGVQIRGLQYKIPGKSGKFLETVIGSLFQTM